jgi:hypothetical protein
MPETQQETDMITLANTKFIIDDEGRRVGALLDIEAYYQLLDELEELEAIRAYDAAKDSGEKAFPFEEAIAQIEN